MPTRAPFILNAAEHSLNDHISLFFNSPALVSLVNRSPNHETKLSKTPLEVFKINTEKWNTVNLKSITNQNLV